MDVSSPKSCCAIKTAPYTMAVSPLQSHVHELVLQTGGHISMKSFIFKKMVPFWWILTLDVGDGSDGLCDF